MTAQNYVESESAGAPIATTNYMSRELVKGHVVNLTLGLCVFLFLFKVFAPVEVWGEGSYLFDIAATALIVGVLASLVPSLVAKTDIRKKKVIQDFDLRIPLPSNLLIHAVAVGLCLMLAVTPFAYLIFKVLNVETISWWMALVLKVLFLLMLGDITIRLALKRALAKVQ